MNAQFIVKEFDLLEDSDNTTYTNLFSTSALANHVNHEGAESSVEGTDYNWEIISTNVIGKKIIVTFLITFIVDWDLE